MAVESIPSDRNQTVNPRVESFDDVPCRGVHCAIDFDMANLSMVEVDGGYVAIDAGTSPLIATTVDAHWQRIAKGELAALILTHSHKDHNGGASVFSQRDVPVWGHRAYFDEFDLTQMLPNAFLTRGAKQFGWQLDEATVETCGIGRPMRDEQGGRRYPIVMPSHVVESEVEEIIGGERFVFKPSPGETWDHLNIWLPERRVYFAGDNLYRAFPNLYAIRGVSPRPIQGWIESLDQIRRLDPKPELLILGHTEPVVGAQTIYDLVTDYRDAIAYVHDSVVRGLNAGRTPDQLVAEIQLPRHLCDHPYLAERYGTLRSSIRAIYCNYMGWFDGDAANLDPVPGVEAAEWLIEECGGVRSVQQKIDLARQKGDSRKALWFAQALFLTNGSRSSRNLKAELLEEQAELKSNPLMRNWFLADADILRGRGKKLQKPKFDGSTIEAIPIEMMLKHLPTRLNPKTSALLETSIGFDITDRELQYTFFIRRGVGEFVSGMVGQPDLIIRATEENFKRVFIASEHSPVSKKFWQALEFVVPEQGVLSSFQRLYRLARMGRLFLRP